MTKEWWKTFFDRNYLAIWGLWGMFRHTKKEVNFLERKIHLNRRNVILDLCCGHGRHSLELAKRGYKVVGLDHSPYEIKLARGKAKEKDISVDFYRGDARTFRSPKKFDVVINMFTAFGYGTRDDDSRIISNVSENLKKGGKFFIDLMSLPYLWRNYQPIRHDTVGGFKIFERRSYDFLENILRTTYVIFEGKHKVTHKARLHMYTLAEMAQLLGNEGLRVIKVFGSYGGSPYGLKSKRMLILARKI